MDQLSQPGSLWVKQKKEWGEILTGFETRNRYVISDGTGKELLFATETGGSFLTRNFLSSYRPFTITIYDASQQIMLTLKRPFRWYFHEVSVYHSDGRLLGSVKKEFSFLRRIYSVFGESGSRIFRLFGPILHPWTFNILSNEQQVGKITKRWSGLLKESFTDADNFGIEFPQDADVEIKAILLGAVFLIDFVHFENNNKN